MLGMFAFCGRCDCRRNLRGGVPGEKGRDTTDPVMILALEGAHDRARYSSGILFGDVMRAWGFRATGLCRASDNSAAFVFTAFGLTPPASTWRTTPVSAMIG